MEIEAQTDARLQRLRRRIEQWRLTRRKHGPMPAELWDEAALLARSLGVCPVSRTLRIGYDALQQRVTARSRRTSEARAPSRSGFVELSGAQLVGTSSPSNGTTVEVVAADGARLSIRLPPSAAFDVAAAIDSFRRQG